MATWAFLALLGGGEMFGMLHGDLHSLGYSLNVTM